VAEYERLVKLKNDPNFFFVPDSPEQNFLNAVYTNQWAEIGFIYNANLAVSYFKPSYWLKYENDIRVIHYTMNKPWACGEPYTRICEKWRNM
jgi:lipopolysaccharide biosynthesis glycosyltransferase